METLQQLLELGYRRYGGVVAVSDPEGALTYADLERAVGGARALLARLGLGVGDRVGVVSANSVDYVVVDQACFTAGVVRVGINRRSTVAELAALAESAELAAVFADAEWVARLAEAGGVGVRVVPLEGERGDRLRDRALGLAPVDAPRLERDDTAALIFTSGTTGAPKAITVTQGNLAATVRNVLIDVPVPHGASALHPIPLSHAAMQLSLALHTRGVRQHYLGQADAGAILEVLAEERLTLLTSVPTVVGMLAREQLARPRDLGALRAIVYGGSSITADDLRAAVDAFGETLYQVYAQSESSLPITCLDPGDHLRAARGDAAILASAGRAGPFVDLVVVDADGEPCPPGVPGEIAIRGDAVTPGYRGDPAATAAAFDPAGRLRTGDVGHLTSDGYLTIVDRLKDVIISGGFNVFPSEVENALRDVAGVSELAVYGVPDPKWGELVCVAVVADDGVDLDAVQAVARERLSGYKIPRALRRYEALPLNATGKVLRRRLREDHGA